MALTNDREKKINEIFLILQVSRFDNIVKWLSITTLMSPQFAIKCCLVNILTLCLYAFIDISDVSLHDIQRCVMFAYIMFYQTYGSIWVLSGYFYSMSFQVVGSRRRVGGALILDLVSLTKYIFQLIMVNWHQIMTQNWVNHKKQSLASIITSFCCIFF